MPASYVHQCVARDACQTEFHDARLRAALCAGSEGPDPFFFSFLALPGSPSAPALGSALHTKKTGDFLVALAKTCATDPLTRAYCCGFFAHYATDTTCHPFVYAHSFDADGHASSTLHCTLEHGLETLVYRRRGHVTGVPVQMGGFISLSASDKDAIARALSSAIDAVYPEHALSAARVRRSFDDAANLCRLLRSPSGRRYRAFGAISGVVGLDRALHAHMMPAEPPQEDIANDAHAPWASPWAPDVQRTESFDDLYRAAVARARECILAANAFMLGNAEESALRAVAGSNSYDSGIDWTRTCPVRALTPPGK